MLTPVAKRVVVKPIEVTHGKLIVTGQKPAQFTVISVGDEVTKVKPGDVIYLEKHYGVEIEHASEKYSVIDEGSILAKITD